MTTVDHRRSTRGAARMLALIEQLELRRGELERILFATPTNGKGVHHLDQACHLLATAIDLLRDAQIPK